MKWLALTLCLVGCSTDTFVGPDGSVGDSGSDDVRSGDGGEGGGGDACASVPMTCAQNALCNSFDQPTPVLAPFSDATQNGGTVTFTSDQFMTCPHAAAATAPQSSGQARGAFGASVNLPGTAIAIAHARIELDAFFPKILSGPAAFIFLYANGDTNNGIGLVWESGNWTVRDSLSGQQQGIDPRVGAWNHVALDVTFSSTSNIGKVEFDYTDSSGKPQQLLFGSNTVANATIQSVAFIAGVIPLAATGAQMTMYADDVVFSPF